MKNYDKIRSLSVEEMAALLSAACKKAEDCVDCPFNKPEFGLCPTSIEKEHWVLWLNSDPSKEQTS